ncbi:hypothetical protein O1L60_04420 [Streptomyces diastatochromogenes]|nr:hypothetical protein [Streptomyces diastatochromogenes]
MRRARICDTRIGFEAFCEANRESYIRYAEKWVDDRAEARLCVEAVFDALEPQWVSVLGTQSPQHGSGRTCGPRPLIAQRMPAVRRRSSMPFFATTRPTSSCSTTTCVCRWIALPV